MAEFDIAIAIVLKHEGGFVDDPDDPGGATNWGISTRFLREVGDPRDAVNLSKEDAILLYRNHFWDKYNYSGIQDQDVANKVMDSSVNMGPAASHKIFQRALRACGNPIKDDGLIGSKTLTAAKEVSLVALKAAMRSEMAGYYRSIISKKPRMAKYKRGWLRRAYEDNL